MNPFGITDKAMLDAEYEASNTYDAYGSGDCDFQAMAAAVKRAFEVLENEITWKLEPEHRRG